MSSIFWVALVLWGMYSLWNPSALTFPVIPTWISSLPVSSSLCCWLRDTGKSTRLRSPNGLCVCIYTLTHIYVCIYTVYRHKLLGHLSLVGWRIAEWIFFFLPFLAFQLLSITLTIETFYTLRCYYWLGWVVGKGGLLACLGAEDSTWPAWLQSAHWYSSPSFMSPSDVVFFKLKQHGGVCRICDLQETWRGARHWCF